MLMRVNADLMLEMQLHFLLNRSEALNEKKREMILQLVHVLYFLKLFTVLLFRNPRKFPLVCITGVNNAQRCR